VEKKIPGGLSKSVFFLKDQTLLFLAILLFFKYLSSFCLMQFHEIKEKLPKQ